MFSEKKRQVGATLIEVLIAVLVLSIGLLGALKLQTEGVRLNANSRYTVLAATYAHDALDALAYDRAGTGDGKAGNWASVNTISGSATGSGSATAWLENLQRDLPDGKAKISCDASARKCSVEISWKPPGESNSVSATYDLSS